MTNSKKAENPLPFSIFGSVLPLLRFICVGMARAAVGAGAAAAAAGGLPLLFIADELEDNEPDDHREGDRNEDRGEHRASPFGWLFVAFGLLFGIKE